MTPEQSERLIDAYPRVDAAKTDKERSSALESLVFARAAPKLPHQLQPDISRLRDDSPGRLFIDVACFAGAALVTAFVRQWILNERGYRDYRKAWTGRDTFW